MSHRLHHVDALKVVASHLIVLHHFTAYGPLADALDLAAPRTTDWFYEYARMAVQIFLVIGGYFAASAIAPHGAMQNPLPWKLVTNRYIRLVPPLLAALILVAFCSAAVSPWLRSDFLPALPTMPQALAHALLLNGILGFDSLSIGIWYVAIDFQLYVMAVGLMWIGRKSGRTMVVVMMLASLFYFNKYESFDNWAPYFFGSYAMGSVAWWAGHSRHARKWLIGLALVGLAALVWDFRLRIGLALGTSLLLGWSRYSMQRPPSKVDLSPRFNRWLKVWSRFSYALFLTHFAVWILANAVWEQLDYKSSSVALLVTALAWLACVTFARLFEQYVERPLAQLRVKI